MSASIGSIPGTGLCQGGRPAIPFASGIGGMRMNGCATSRQTGRKARSNRSARPFGNARCQRFRITGSERVSIGFAEVIPVIEDFENELIAFFPVLPGEVWRLSIAGFDGLKPVSLERLAHRPTSGFDGP